MTDNFGNSSSVMENAENLPVISPIFPPLHIHNHTLLPIIQGGMGIGISAHRLAGAVAKEGAIGTIASVELRRLHPDLMQASLHCRDSAAYCDANLRALQREIQQARDYAGNQAFISVNVMHALKHYAALVVEACKSGANAITMGAGLPFDLPDLVRNFKNVALIPILSEARGVQVLLKRWLRKSAIPAAIVLEHPRYAGGHLGASKMEDIASPHFDFAQVLDETHTVLHKLGLAQEKIPLIAAGGINSSKKIQEMLTLGASGVQLGTAFAVTEEGDAHLTFKKVLLEATPDKIITFMSTAGLPARAVLTPWLERYLKKEAHLRARACPSRAHCPRQLECLEHCGFKDGNPKAGQFCIETQLAAAQRGEYTRGLFFRGASSLPFGDKICSVKQLLQHLLNPAQDAI